MRFSILGDDNPTTLEASVVGENTDNSVPDTSRSAGAFKIPDDITHSPLPETAEYLVLSPPPRSQSRRVLHAAGLAVLVVALAIWPLIAGPDNQTERVAATSGVVPRWAPAEPQPAMPMPSEANTGSNAEVNRPAAYVAFCQNSPTLCAPAVTLPATGYRQFCHNSPAQEGPG